MQNALSLLCWLSVAALLITCRPDPEPDPLADGKPRIISIQFPGIPEKNVTIDQKNLLITIKVPPVLLEYINPAIKYANNGTASVDEIRMIFMPSGNRATGESVLRVGRIGSNDPVVTYRVQLIPFGPIELGVGEDTIRYFINDRDINKQGIAIPLVNLYGNRLPVAAELVHRTTKEKFLIDDNRMVAGGISKLMLQMFPSDKVLPGTYDVALKMADGRTLSYPQPVLVKKGPADIIIESIKDLIPGTTLSMLGVNLYAGDIALQLTDREGKTFSMTNLSFETYGRKMDATVPADLPAGSYLMQLFQFGQPRGGCSILTVWKGEVPDARIKTIGLIKPCSLPKSIGVVRNIPIPLGYNFTTKLPDQPRMKLVPTDCTQAVYYGTVTPYIIYNHITYRQATVTLGMDVPPGLYTPSLQYLDKDGQVVAESEPYGAKLEVLY